MKPRKVSKSRHLAWLAVPPGLPRPDSLQSEIFLSGSQAIHVEVIFLFLFVTYSSNAFCRDCGDAPTGNVSEIVQRHERT